MGIRFVRSLSLAFALRCDSLIAMRIDVPRLLALPKGVFFGVTLFLVFVGGALAIWWPGENPTQRHESEAGGLVCGEALWDFGSVDSLEEPEVSHEFVLRNKCAKAVQIREVRSSCGCMVAEGYERALPPGACTSIRVKLSLPPRPTQFQRTMLVGLETSPAQWLSLEIKGTVVANASMYSIPSQINFGTVRQGETKERTVELARFDFTPIVITEATGSGVALRCSFGSQRVPDGTSPIVHVSLSGDSLLPGPYAGAITVVTTDHRFSKLTVPVSATILPLDTGSANQTSE